MTNKKKRRTSKTRPLPCPMMSPEVVADPFGVYHQKRRGFGGWSRDDVSAIGLAALPPWLIDKTVKS